MFVSLIFPISLYCSFALCHIIPRSCFTFPFFIRYFTFFFVFSSFSFFPSFFVLSLLPFFFFFLVFILFYFFYIFFLLTLLFLFSFAIFPPIYCRSFYIFLSVSTITFCSFFTSLFLTLKKISSPFYLIFLSFLSFSPPFSLIFFSLSHDIFFFFHTFVVRLIITVFLSFFFVCDFSCFRLSVYFIWLIQLSITSYFNLIIFLILLHVIIYWLFFFYSLFINCFFSSPNKLRVTFFNEFIFVGFFSPIIQCFCVIFCFISITLCSISCSLFYLFFCFLFLYTILCVFLHISIPPLFTF